jgi:hypothetical protein
MRMNVHSHEAPQIWLQNGDCVPWLTGPPIALEFFELTGFQEKTRAAFRDVPLKRPSPR